MNITGTLSEFLLTLALGGILLLVSVLLSGGVKRTNGDWTIGKAPWYFRFVFAVIALSIVGIAVHDKLFAVQQVGSTIEISRLRLDWGGGTGDNNGQLVELSPPRIADDRNPQLKAWEWVAKSSFKHEFAGKPDMAISLVEVADRFADKRYEIRATPLGNGQFEVRLTVWGLSSEGLPRLQFTVECVSVGSIRPFR